MCRIRVDCSLLCVIKKRRRDICSVWRIIRFPCEKIKTLHSIKIYGAGGRDEKLHKRLLNKTFKRPPKISFIKSANGRSNGPFTPSLVNTHEIDPLRRYIYPTCRWKRMHRVNNTWWWNSRLCSFNAIIHWNLHSCCRNVMEWWQRYSWPKEMANATKKPWVFMSITS